MLKDLFEQDITRDISAVVYFHQDDPRRLQEEVSEYIITGGYRGDDPRRDRVPDGIHECYVRLMRELARQLPNKPQSPACWISGFYGSGKSSFAKLLGLSLDGRTLPSGQALSEAWLQRDRSPRSQDLRDAWHELTGDIEPMAVVFDIGGEARDNEHIHATAVRQVQKRLGYSAKNKVAEGELGLEKKGLYSKVEALSQTHLGEPWSKAKNDHFAEDSFSAILHHLNPGVYPDTMSWVDSHEGRATHTLSTSEATRAIADMLEQRAPNATLFLVVDEVSQYIHQDDRRMLKLQSFVSDLGERLQGRVWLLVTGQEQLDDQNASHTLGKMKDRFPPSLRVHLSPTNIRDVVHRRLLEKKPERTPELRALFQRHRADLKLYALDCEHITESDFVEVYPMLPGHVDLLLEITQALRNRASRSQGDDHAIRSLLQLLGELFRTLKLAKEQIGRLITLDDIFAIQGSALPGGTQKTLIKVREHCGREHDELALRAAKAVAFLELIAERRPTTVELVAQALYDRVDRGNNVDAVRDALHGLRKASLLTYSQKRGYKLQSSSGQEWSTERAKHSITLDAISALVQSKLTNVSLPKVDVPRHRGAPFKIAAWYSDGRQADDQPLKHHRNEATFGVDFRFQAYDAQHHSHWVRTSSEQRLRHRLVWVVGQTAEVHETARALARSRYMVSRYDAQRSSLSQDKVELLNLEQNRQRDLERSLADMVEAAFCQGALYFRGAPLHTDDLGSTFATLLQSAASRLLPDLYPHFDATNITQAELAQLLDKSVLSGVSTKFLSAGLGILTLDSGKYQATCDGAVPARLLQFIEESGGSAGSVFFSHFAQPPYGYAASLLRACLAGLLRAKRIQIRTESGKMLTSHNDPGVRELFRGDRDLRRSELLLAAEGDVRPRDRVAISRFFKARLQRDVDTDMDALADAVFTEFPALGKQLRDVLALLGRLPGHTAVDPALAKLGNALENCQRSRHIEPTVIAVKQNLDALNDGVERLKMDRQTLSDDAIHQVRRLHNLVHHHLHQLQDVDQVEALTAQAATSVRAQLDSPRPWDGVLGLIGAGDTLTDAYSEARKHVVQTQVSREEQARSRVKAREGFERLSSDQQHHLLRPLAEPSQGIDPSATQPTLRAADAQAQLALQHAEQQAYRVLDEILHPQTPTTRVKTQLAHREIRHIDELDALTAKLRERVLIELDAGKKVRLQ